LRFATRIIIGGSVEDKAEAEGKVVFYTTANTSGVKAIGDGFKKLYLGSLSHSPAPPIPN
jgi:hypothetical protein